MEYTIEEYENAEIEENIDDSQWNDSDSSVLTAYLKEISKYPVLSREQEMIYLNDCQKGTKLLAKH